MSAGLVLSDDLIFTSRIMGASQAHGRAVQPARTLEQLLALAGQAPPACVFVDLAFPGLNVAELLAGLRAACDPAPFVVAYGPHVDAAALHAARAAGCGLVLPRSAFVERLPVELPRWFGADA